MRKILLILVVCLCFCSCAEKGKMIKEQAVSSEVLQEQQAEVFESVTKDFDGNGTEETFQLRREGKNVKTLVCRRWRRNPSGSGGKFCRV